MMTIIYYNIVYPQSPILIKATILGGFFACLLEGSRLVTGLLIGTFVEVIVMRIPAGLITVPPTPLSAGFSFHLCPPRTLNPNP